MPSMLSAERRAHLLAALDRDGAIRLDAVAAELGVSAMTVRRDLLDLETEGLVRRVRGGAVAPVLPRTFGDRMARRGAAKAAIARKARDLVPTTGAIAFDGSSTSGALIAAIDGGDGLVIATNSLENAAAARRRPGIRSVLIGGELDERTGSFVGPVAARAAQSLGYRRFFLSASALHPRFGASEATLDEAQLKLDFAAVADEVVLLADASKLDSRAVARGLDWSAVDVLVTELEPGDERLAAYRDLVEVR